jgi:transcriptional regulator with XRE-family HTH domain
MSRLGTLLRETRERHGVSQRQLAIRAGTKQSTISRLERGLESPSFERFEALLLCLGERAELELRPLSHRADPEHLAEARSMPVGERLERALGWNEFAAEIAGQALEQELDRR